MIEQQENKRRAAHQPAVEARKAELVLRGRIAALRRFARRQQLAENEREEIVQEVLLVFAKQPPLLQGELTRHGLDAWFRKVFRRKMADARRRQQRLRVEALNGQAEVLMDRQEAEPAAMEAEQRREWQLTLLEKLRESDPLNYRLLHGRFFERRSVQELAAAEGLTANQVSCRIYAARRQLRKQASKLQDEGADSR